MYAKGENIEHQILEAIKEVLKFKDPDTIKASIILNRLRTILGLKDLASAPDLYEALEFLVDFVEMPVDEYLDKYGAGITSKQACDKARKAIAKAEVNL